MIRLPAVLKVIALFFAATAIGCATGQKEKYAFKEPRPSAYLEAAKRPAPLGPPPMEEKLTPYLPSPANKPKLLSLHFDGAPLGQVLQALAEDSSMGLLIAPDVDINIPIYVHLKHATQEEALRTVITEGADFFHSVEGLTIRVQRHDEAFFRLDYLKTPRLTTTKVGGDILGGASTGGGGSASSSIVGEFTVASTEAKEETNLWAQLGASLTAMKSSEGVVVVQPASGTVYISDRPSHMAKMRKIILEVRKMIMSQVLIEARILEVQLRDQTQIGIQWDAASRFSLFGREGAFKIVQNLGLGIGTGQGADVTSVGTGGAIGVSIFGVDALIDFLQTQGEVKVLSNPYLLVMNGQSAVITIGSQFPFGDVAGVSISDEGRVTFDSSIKRALLGLQLGITPHITEEGEVLLHVLPSITNLQGETIVEIPTTGGKVQQIRNPIIDLRQMGTMIRAREGQSVVLAGLIRRERNLEEEGIPYLSRIPIIGALFKNRNETQSISELVVIITPRIGTPGTRGTF